MDDPLFNVVNHAAQGHITLVQARGWFEAQTAEMQRSVLGAAAVALTQSHPTVAETESGIRQAPLRATHTPAVLLMKFPSKLAVPKVLALPESEWGRVFVALVSVFSVADARRRLACGADCSHSWHQLGPGWVLPDVAR